MARLKFLVFAVIALGLWGYHLAQIPPLAVTGAVEQAHASVAGATAPFAVALEARRSLVQLTALKVASTAGAVWNAGPKAGAKPEAPTVDRIAAARAAAQDAAPDFKDALFVAVVNDVGSLSVKGPGEPGATAPEGVDFAAITAAGAQGTLITLEGASYLAVAVPMAISDKNEVRQAGSVIVALPLLPDAKLLETVAKSFNLQALALLADGKPVLKTGSENSLSAALGKLKPGTTAALSEGPVRELGPIALPTMTATTAHEVGGRQAIEGTAFEVVAVASSRAALESLAGYQVFALGGLVGLLLLTLVFTIIMGGATEEGGGMVLPPPMPVPPKRPESGLKPAFQPTADAPAPQTHEPAPAEASPDDFDFPPAGSTGQNQAFQPPPPAPAQNFAPPPPMQTQPFSEPTSDPFAQHAPPPPPPARPAPPPPPVATSEVAAFQPPAGNGLMDDDDEGQRTVAYPAFKAPPGAGPGPQAQAPIDPFALAAAQEDPPPAPGFDDNVDATRVAAVPAELIKAARAGSAGATAERPAIKPPPAVAAPKVAAVGGANDEERHFQEVFRDFVSTREKCREPADGLTYDKFKQKLLKNKEQLVAKYQCRTVRFQVYVKDGKAALKATPVKD